MHGYWTCQKHLYTRLAHFNGLLECNDWTGPNLGSTKKIKNLLKVHVHETLCFKYNLSLHEINESNTPANSPCWTIPDRQPHPSMQAVSLQPISGSSPILRQFWGQGCIHSKYSMLLGHIIAGISNQDNNKIS